jgi:hypothetical protein
MASVSRQIGWSQESNLLYQILKQLTRLTSIIFGLKPKYKVYTALLTQSGEDDPLDVDSGLLTIGVTYMINNPSVESDFTNVGAPNNLSGTYFIATGTTPNNWGTNTSILNYNTGAPVVTVLENTIGNVWFTYDSTGIYFINSDGLFTLNKTFAPSVVINNTPRIITINVGNINVIELVSNEGDSTLNNAPIEIRVYN